MTNILIIGGGGMVGQKLAASLAAEGFEGDTTPDVTLFDIAFPETGAPAARRVTGDVSDTSLMQALVAKRPDVIFHLASIVSGEAESNFDLG